MNETARMIGAEFSSVHLAMRELVSSLDRSAVNWKPHPEANSLAVLVAHTLGSEGEILRAVRGQVANRNRPAEFEVEADAMDLVTMIDRADADLEEQISNMTDDDLTGMRRRGDRPPRPGLDWLVTNYGHAREHLAQMQLTIQLYGAKA